MWNQGKHKFRAKRVEVDGFQFPSQLEGAVFKILKLEELAGELEIVRRQSRVKLTLAEILYIPDFECIATATRNPFFVEAKGFETSDWRLKRRLWKFYGPAPLHIYKGTWKHPHLAEIIEPVLPLLGVDENLDELAKGDDKPEEEKGTA